MDCDPRTFEAPAGSLAETVAAMRGSVVVLVDRSDGGAARRELRAVPRADDRHVTVVAAQLDGRSLADAATRMFAVPGRCAVLAAEEEHGWTLVVTPGATPGVARASPLPVPDVPRAPADPMRIDTTWIGLGGQLGTPYLLPAGVLSFQLGPVYADAALSFLLVAGSGDGHVGFLLPVRRVERGDGALSAGAAVGGGGVSSVFGESTGSEVVLVGEYTQRARWDLRVVPSGPPRAWMFVRVQAGVGLWDHGDRWGAAVEPVLICAMGMKGGRGQ
jgi:hypothetical protein